MGEGRKRFEGTTLKSWEDVDLHLKEIGELDLSLKAIEASMNLAISDRKLAAEMEAKPLRDRRAKLELEVKEFVEENKAEIPGKTMKLNFGTTGFRQSTKFIIRNVKAVLAALKSRGMTDCIKTQESVVKENFKGYSDEVLADIGIRRKQEDVFWLEPDYEKLKGV